MWNGLYRRLVLTYNGTHLATKINIHVTWHCRICTGCSLMLYIQWQRLHFYLMTCTLYTNTVHMWHYYQQLHTSAVASRLCQLQLLPPIIDLLQLLLPGCVRFSCCSLLSPVLDSFRYRNVLGSHPLHVVRTTAVHSSSLVICHLNCDMVTPPTWRENTNNGQSKCLPLGKSCGLTASDGSIHSAVND